jgi:hypothetical protein
MTTSTIGKSHKPIERGRRSMPVSRAIVSIGQVPMQMASMQFGSLSGNRICAAFSASASVHPPPTICSWVHESQNTFARYVSSFGHMGGGVPASWLTTWSLESWHICGVLPFAKQSFSQACVPEEWSGSVLPHRSAALPSQAQWHVQVVPLNIQSMTLQAG